MSETTDLTAPPYPSRNPFPILERLDLDVTGIEVHVSNYRTDARDAAYVIRKQAAEIDRLRSETVRLGGAVMSGAEAGF